MRINYSLAMFLFLLVPVLTWAQGMVTSTEILAKINKGEAVAYQNTTITGNLDLTQLQNKTLKTRQGNDGAYGTKEYVSTVTVPVSFVNCTFKGNVVAYWNPNDKDGDGQTDLKEGMAELNEFYKADFKKDVVFANCVFEGLSAFKYSEFQGAASFQGSTFGREANFKYSKFTQKTDFAKATFKEMANFKYVKFPEEVNFAGAVFTGGGNFKYVAFASGADFQNAVFNGLANFKYAKLSDPVQWKGAAFNGGKDLKYASLNSKAFGASALQEKAK